MKTLMKSAAGTAAGMVLASCAMAQQPVPPAPPVAPVAPMVPVPPPGHPMMLPPGQPGTIGGPFDRVQVSGSARVELTQGDKDQAVVASEEPRGVRLMVHNGQLQIRTEDNWKFWNSDPVLVRVQVRQLTQLGISGAGDIVASKSLKVGDLQVNISGQGQVRLADVTADKLRFDISGSGAGELAGRVAELQMRISGRGQMKADRLKSGRAEVTISGLGQSDVWATDELKVWVSGVGTVNYWGRPKVERYISGVSEITAKGDR